MIMKYKKMSNRKRTYSNKKSTIFDIALKTKKYKTILLQLIVIPRIDFRTKCRKQASDTEVGRDPGGKTSVPNAENGPLIRKAAKAQGVKSASVAIGSPGRRLPGQAF